MSSKKDQEMLKKATLLKLALRIHGIRVMDNVKGVGESIKENINGLYQTNKEDADYIDPIPNELVLYKNITTKLVSKQNSFFSLKKMNGQFYVFSDFAKEPLIRVEFSKRPKHYGLTTTKGTPMKYVGQVMGNDCLAIAVDKQCHYFTNGNFCKYCNITPTNFRSKIARFSDLNDIAELIRAAGKYYKYVDLTGGTFKDRDLECKTYAKIGNIIRDNIGRKNYSGPFSLSPPNDLKLLEKLRETNVDVVSFNMDVWNDNALKKICPGKYKLGKAAYESALLKAKELWGEGNSVMQFLAGPWETNESLLEGTTHFLDLGILVNITTFGSSPCSALKNIQPKKLKELAELYVRYGDLIKEYGFYPNSRKSILTSESGNRSSIVNEVVKGYLTSENFDPINDLKFAGGFGK